MSFENWDKFVMKTLSHLTEQVCNKSDCIFKDTCESRKATKSIKREAAALKERADRK